VSSSLLRWLRIVALAEATSFLLLLGASYAKHAHDAGVGVSVLGPIHGLLFMAYIVLALHGSGEAGWSRRTTTWILIGAVVPFGGFVVDRWLVRNVRPVDAV
jgi:integral membrane protein